MVEWQDVPGYEGLYEVSDDGRVRRGGVELRSGAQGGYVRFTLSKDGKPWRISAHRLVAMVFIPNPDGLPVVRHLDDDRTNNTVENLAWGTPADNTADAIRNGRWLNRGEGRRFCNAGAHDWTEDNIRRSWSDGRGGRWIETCRSCERTRRRERSAREIDARGGPQKPGPKTTRTPEEQAEARRLSWRRYAEKHPEERAVRHREWAQQNRDHLAEYARDRRSKRDGQ